MPCYKVVENKKIKLLHIHFTFKEIVSYHRNAHNVSNAGKMQDVYDAEW